MSDQEILQRGRDMLFAFFLIFALSPLFLLVSLIVKITSRGPVIFKQKRVGKAGKSFTFYKFRTMYTNNSDSIHREYLERLIKNNEKRGGVYKITDDPRITPVGKILRRTSLDEFPQLFNVLKGDMSLLGPRPPLPYEVELYNGWQKKRLSVKPGITGLWQVSGRTLLGFDEQVRLDIKYIRDHSLTRDLVILFKTIPAVLSLKGAY